jgi:hypothetical protein
LSTFGSRFWITPILSWTFAPPRIATKGRSGLAERLPQVAQLFLHQQACDGGQVVRDAFSGGVRAVRRAERIVHIDLAQPRQRTRKLRVVRLLLRVEAHILQQRDRVRRQARHARFHRRADAVVEEVDGTPQQLLQSRRHRAQAILRVALPLRTPEVRHQNHRRAALQQVLNRR